MPKYDAVFKNTRSPILTLLRSHVCGSTSTLDCCHLNHHPYIVPISRHPLSFLLIFYHSFLLLFNDHSWRHLSIIVFTQMPFITSLLATHHCALKHIHTQSNGSQFAPVSRRTDCLVQSTLVTLLLQIFILRILFSSTNKLVTYYAILLALIDNCSPVGESRRTCTGKKELIRSTKKCALVYQEKGQSALHWCIF